MFKSLMSRQGNTGAAVADRMDRTVDRTAGTRGAKTMSVAFVNRKRFHKNFPFTVQPCHAVKDRAEDQQGQNNGKAYQLLLAFQLFQCILHVIPRSCKILIAYKLQTA